MRDTFGRHRPCVPGNGFDCPPSKDGGSQLNGARQGVILVLGVKQPCSKIYPITGITPMRMAQGMYFVITAHGTPEPMQKAREPNFGGSTRLQSGSGRLRCCMIRYDIVA